MAAALVAAVSVSIVVPLGLAQAAAPGDDLLRIPGLPPIITHPDGRAFGPPGLLPQGQSLAPRLRRAPQEAAKPQTPAERAAAIRKALAPRPPLSALRRQTLDELYAKLASASDEEEAKGLADLITAIWMRSGSDTADLLMQRAMTSLAAKNKPLALKLLDQLVVIRPNWPEAWNKRAAVRAALGDLDGAMADVDHVLKLDPRHFGALDGMGSILEQTGFHKRALEVFRRALTVYPHQPEVEQIVEKLQLEVEGQGI